MKRHMFLLLALTLMALPAMAYTFEYSYEGQTLLYDVLDEEAKTCEVARYNKVSGELKIPEVAQGYNVISISNNAFMRSTGLVSVEIPNSVTSIGRSAFYSCSGLISVSFSDSVESIGKWAFHGCSSLISISIPESILEIEDGVFEQCVSLTSVKLPSSIRSINKGSFEDCKSLSSVELPNSIFVIDQNAFSGCSALTSIEIPASVVGIGPAAFGNCGSLTSITVDINNKKFFSIGGVVFNKNNNNEIALNCYPAGKSDVQYIIPDSVNIIDQDAFLGCRTLTSVEIPKSVYYIDKRAFIDCDKLSAITVDSNNGSFASLNGVLFNRDYTLLKRYPNCKNETEYSIPNTVTIIEDYAFYDCQSLTSVEIPNSVITIGDYAFTGCESLVSIEIPNSITSIGSYAFCFCIKLTSVKIANSVISIGSSAFNFCNELTSVEIPESVTSIGSYVFCTCNNLTEITCRAIVPPSCGEDIVDDFETITLYVPESAVEAYKTAEVWKEFVNIVGLKSDEPFEAVIDGLHYILNPTNNTAEVTSEAEDSSNYKDKISFRIPEKVKYEGNEYTVTAIGDKAFYFCVSLGAIVIPNTIKSIGKEAFGMCSGLFLIDIPSSVMTIGNDVFNGCIQLTNINVDTDNDYYSSINGVLFNKEVTEIIRYPNGKKEKEYSIPNSVHTIGLSAFYNCTRLRSIEIPGIVTTICDYAFNRCSALTSINLPDAVTIIGNYAFRGCSGLTSIDFPNSLTSIGRYAFFGCNGLTSIDLPKSVTSMGSYVFGSCSSLTAITSRAETPPSCDGKIVSDYNVVTLYIPERALDKYKAAQEWKEFLNIEAIDEPGVIVETETDCNDIEIADGAIVVNGPGKVSVYNMTGGLKYSGPTGRIELPAGVYLVVTDVVSVKIRL